MPFIRGRILPETELAGRAKTFLDVLVWIREPRERDIRALDELEILRTYLNSIPGFAGQIRLWVPEHLKKTINVMEHAAIKFSVIDSKRAEDNVRQQLKGAD